MLIILLLQGTANLINVELPRFLNISFRLYIFKVISDIPIELLDTLLSLDGFDALLLIQTLLRFVSLENLVKITPQYFFFIRLPRFCELGCQRERLRIEKMREWARILKFY